MRATSLLLAATALAGCATVSTPAEAARRTSAPKVTISDVTAGEADGVLTFVATRSVCTGTSSMSYKTIDGTALAGSDYVAVSGTATWGDGVCSTNIPITIISASTTEPTERFTLKLRAGTNVKLADTTAIGTITDEPAAPPPPTEEEEPPEEAPDPTTKLCSDGSEIPIGDDCPPETPERDPLLGDIDIASEFNYNLGIQSISLQAKSAAPDVVGAFRFVCSAGKLGRFDPIVYPGQSSAGHLHQFYGNDSVTGSSTYASLRASGVSTCGQDSTGTYSVNRSAYWMPAMLDGRGNVVKPDYVLIYYKRRPESDPKCQGFANGGEGTCVDLPNGIKFVFGYDMVSGQAPTGSAYYTCKGTGAIPGTYANLAQVVGKCPAGAQVGAIIKAPACWDGKNLDSPNHRDHVQFYRRDPNTGVNACPSTHTYVIPGFTLHAWYSVQTGDDLSLWSLSSDSMFPNLPKGSTFHADFFMAWDPTVKQMWHDNCINLLLNCSSGDLGNMKQLKGQAGPIYNGVVSWKNPTPRVAVPN